MIDASYNTTLGINIIIQSPFLFVDKRLYIYRRDLTVVLFERHLAFRPLRSQCQCEVLDDIKSIHLILNDVTLQTITSFSHNTTRQINPQKEPKYLAGQRSNGSFLIFDFRNKGTCAKKYV